MEIHYGTYIIALFGAFCGGLIDSIAGGGGLITVPVLLALGIPPHLALGTNKFQALFGSLTSSARYRFKGLYTFKEVRWGIPFTILGALLGTYSVNIIDPDILERFLPFLLGAIFLYTLLAKKQLNTENTSNDKYYKWIIIGLILGFYDGFLGPGTGSFWAIGLVILMGFDLKKSTGLTKPMNFLSNITSFIVFLILGKVLWLLGIIMAIGAFCGAWTGTHLVVKKGVKFIRPLFLIVVGATILKLIFFRS
ncbi:TSUP family transporter [Spirochaeta cellobiosiphila]|uniref:TSUP family transporter n=1 Tax=Spirochaeta cellobiosiphila TaxID=504483 RepID=UPI00040162BA|nr:TSUP family transporter [Spirochaeta cellobiosiphila]